MYILLTDVLTCPRCGPDFGLILLADRVDDRRVGEGRLGCANCRNQYPIHGGVVDVRLTGAPVEDDPAFASGPAPAPDAAVRLAALMGLANASGTALVVGPGAAAAPVIASLVEGLEVAALTSSPAPSSADQPPVTRIAGGPSLPFRSHALRGVALTAGGGEALLDEAVRVAQPGAHVVVENAAAGTARALEARGARVLLEQEGTVVAAVAGAPVQLRMNAVR